MPQTGCYGGFNSFWFCFGLELELERIPNNNPWSKRKILLILRMGSNNSNPTIGSMKLILEEQILRILLACSWKTGNLLRNCLKPSRIKLGGLFLDGSTAMFEQIYFQKSLCRVSFPSPLFTSKKGLLEIWHLFSTGIFC